MTQTAPFIRILPPAALGIVAANTFQIPWWLIITALAITYAMAWLGTKSERISSGIYVWTAIFFTFVLLGKHALPHTDLPQDERLTMVAILKEDLLKQGKWQVATAKVSAYRYGQADWRKVNEKVMISIDTSYRLKAGDEFAIKGYVNGFGDGGYARLMKRRGFDGRVYVSAGNIIEVSKVTRFAPMAYARRMQTAALESIERLGLSKTGYEVASAMTVGWRQSMSKELKEDYGRSGTAHILSVSGLHVGIVFGLINILLWLLPTFRRGHIAKNVIAILLIWLYAAVTGFSPSVVRSAMMFSGAQIAMATTSIRQPLNILLATATLMLVINPNNLYDISFQLSFVAVLFIMLWFTPIYRAIRTQYKILNGLISVVLIGVVATLATAPIVSHTFGYFSLIGVVINPVVVLTAHIAVLLTLVWVIAPIGFLTPVFKFLVGWSVDIQNAVVNWGAARSWAAVDYTLPIWSVFVIYSLFIAITLLVTNFHKEKELTLPR